MSHSPYQVMDGDPTPHPKNHPALLIHSSSSFLQSFSMSFLLNTISSLHCFFSFQFSGVATMVIIHKEILLKSFYILAPCFEQCVETFFRIKGNWWFFKRGSIRQTIYFWKKKFSKWQKFAKKKKKKNKNSTYRVHKLTRKTHSIPQSSENWQSLPTYHNQIMNQNGLNKKIIKNIFMCNGLSWQIKVLYCGPWSIRRQVLHSQTSIYHSLLSMIRTSHPDPEPGVKTWERRLHTLRQAKG